MATSSGPPGGDSSTEIAGTTAAARPWTLSCRTRGAAWWMGRVMTNTGASDEVWPASSTVSRAASDLDIIEPVACGHGDGADRDAAEAVGEPTHESDLVGIPDGERADGRSTASTTGAQEIDARRRPRPVSAMVEGSDSIARRHVSSAGLDGDGALSRGGRHQRGIDALRDPIAATEAQQPRHREHQRLRYSVVQSAKPRVHVAVDGPHIQVRPDRSQEGGSAWAIGADDGTCRQVLAGP